MTAPARHAPACRAPAEPADAGFTLIEALVALAILAIAAVGIVRAAEAHVDRIAGLETRQAAAWAAENALAEARLGLAAPGTRRTLMLTYPFEVTLRLDGSADPDLNRATVEVRLEGTGAPLVTMEGFVDAGGTAR